MALVRVLVAEPSVPIANAFRKFLDGWADVQVVTSAVEVAEVVSVSPPPQVLIASVSERFDGEALVSFVRRVAPETALVLAYSPTEVESAPERARRFKVDGFVVGPFKKHQVLGMVQAVARLNGLAAQLRELSAQFAALKSKRQAARVRSPGVNAPDEAFFRKSMLLEVKRSKRYRYPVALLLVSFDQLQQRLGEGRAHVDRAAIRSEALEALSVLLRDIDVAFPFGEDRYLVFLPHTPLVGSTIVAGRIVERLAQLKSFKDGTVSVGVASFDVAVEKRDQVSLGALVREAGVALKRAQTAGGNRFEAPEIPKPPKRSRISMG